MKLESNGMPTKRNGAGNQQNYVPAGNEDGGEYTFDSDTGKPSATPPSKIAKTAQKPPEEPSPTSIEVTEGSENKTGSSFRKFVDDREDYTPQFREYIKKEYEAGSPQSCSVIDSLISDGKINYNESSGGRSACMGGTNISLSTKGSNARLQGEVFWHESFHAVDQKCMALFSGAELADKAKSISFDSVFDLRKIDVTMGKTCSTAVILPSGETMYDIQQAEFRAIRKKIKNDGFSYIRTDYAKAEREGLLEAYPDYDQIVADHDRLVADTTSQLLADYGVADFTELSSWQRHEFIKRKTQILEENPLQQKFAEIQKYRRTTLSEKLFQQWGGVSDMYQAMGYDPFNGGHTKTYFKTKSCAPMEFFAEYGSAYSTGDTKTLENFERYFPETSKACKYIIEEIYKRNKK